MQTALKRAMAIAIGLGRIFSTGTPPLAITAPCFFGTIE